MCPRSSRKTCQRKIVSLEQLLQALGPIRLSGKTLVSLNGSFDLLHAGHLEILFSAAEQGDFLVVALNSDLSVQRYKGPNRPIIPLKYRLEMISAIECVDYVTWFDELDPRVILGQIKPDVHVNGREYGENCIEKEVVESAGGRIHLVDRIPGLATSEIIQKICHG